MQRVIQYIDSTKKIDIENLSKAYYSLVHLTNSINQIVKWQIRYILLKGDNTGIVLKHTKQISVRDLQCNRSIGGYNLVKSINSYESYRSRIKLNEFFKH